jgi:hypothetical protein
MRKARPILRLSMLIFLAAFALALCVVGAKSQTGKTVTVTITPGSPITVSPDPAIISKSNGDQVDWVCPKCTSGFKIHFPKGSPFTSSDFGPSNAASGKAKANAALKTYPYSVTVNGQTIDPGVRLTP